MLDDLNKIVPELDDNDKNVIFNNINNKMNTKKAKNPFNFKIAIAALSFAVLLLIFIPIGISMSNNKGNNPIAPTNNSNENLDGYNNHKFETSESILGVAAFRPFDSKNNNNTNKANSISIYDNLCENKAYFKDPEDNTQSFYVSYPFDYVRINKAFKFNVEVEDITNATAKEIIETNCGLGSLEVVIAEFTTYEAEPLRETIKETLISIRGYNGYYTILLNSKSGDTKYTFSSHKKISSNSIIKDSTPPIIRINVIKNDNNYSIGFFGCDNEDAADNIYDYNFFTSTGNIEYASHDDLYSVLELTKVPTKKIEAVITDILVIDNSDVDDENKKIIYYCFYVQAETNLERVWIDAYDNEVENISDFKVGDVIIIEYDQLYYTYDPVVITVNRLTKAEK